MKPWLPCLPLPPLLLAASGLASAHGDAGLHAAIDADVATLSAAAESGEWQRCLELGAEGRELAEGHADFEAERLARRETLRELAAAADTAGEAHQAAVSEHGPSSDAARASRDLYEHAITAHRTEGDAYNEFLRPRNEVIGRYEDQRKALERVCPPLEAAESRWVKAREQMADWCEAYAQKLRRIAAGQMLDHLGDRDAKLHAQAGIDRELAAHGCLHPVRAREYERATSGPAASD